MPMLKYTGLGELWLLLLLICFLSIQALTLDSFRMTKLLTVGLNVIAKLGPSSCKRLSPRSTNGISLLEDGQILHCLEAHLFFPFCMLHATVLALLVGLPMFSIVYVLTKDAV